MNVKDRPLRLFGLIALAALIAALIGGVLLGPREPHVSAYSPTYTPEHHNVIAPASCHPAASRAALKDAHNSDCDPEAQHKEDREESGALQAIRQADAAEKTVVVAQYQAWAVFWQTFATIGAFIAASVAGYFAYKAAKAADDTLNHTYLTSERELRAYVFVHETRIKTVDDGAHFIRYGYRNTGNTPAKNVQVRVRAIIAPKGAPIDFDDLGLEKNIGPLGPRDERVGDEVIDVPQDAVAHGEAHGLDSLEVRFYGRIDYGDEFCPKRWTIFNCVHPGPATHGKTLHTVEGHNDYK